MSKRRLIRSHILVTGECRRRVMKVDRLFNVLVLGGAALAAACSDNHGSTGSAVTPTGTAGSQGTSTTDGTGGAATTSSGAGGASAGTGGEGGADSDGGLAAGGGGTSSTGGAAGAGEGGAAGGGSGGRGADASSVGGSASMGADAALMCSKTPSASDPCGCPCCWVTNCLNTEACCKGLSPCAPK
jgi:hypothetical protein